VAGSDGHRGDSFGHSSFLVCKWGNRTGVNVTKVIRERIRTRVAGVDLDADVNAAVAADVGERRQRSVVSSTSRAASGRPAEKPERPGS
jgi:hypothetical protein